MTPEQEALREKVARAIEQILLTARLQPATENPYALEADAAIAVALNWQPIETAPRDGTPFLGWNGHWRGVVRYWHPIYADDPKWVDECAEFIEPQPTHWMPLPPPPALNPSGSPAAS